MSSKFTKCGGIIGFLFSLKKIINKVLPDRIVIAWDGFNAGKLRYNIYKPYKISRGKNFENENRAIYTEGTGSPEDMERFEVYRQKIALQNILEEMFIRQVEVDYIEADDIIAQYVIKSESEADDEHIYIFSKDKDYLQLMSEKVSIITNDNLFVFNRQQYEEKYGHTLDNELLMKSFEGDKGDDIAGVLGITRDTLMKYFPSIKTEKYTYARLREEAYEAKKDKKIGKRKIYDKVIQAEHVLYRNAKLMNLKKPFLSNEAVKQVNVVKNGILDDSREITSAISLFREEGLMNYVGEEYSQDFFSTFYMVMLKEKEYAQKMKL